MRTRRRRRASAAAARWRGGGGRTPREAVTDEGGYFILRELPAGEMSVTLRTPVPLPDGAVPPTGLMRMPFEPTPVNDADSVIRSAGPSERAVAARTNCRPRPRK